MIPKKAIKKIKNPTHVEIAVGTLIAYGVFPQTNEGIQKAKNTLEGKEEWLAPSDLPEYYDGIESDLITGKETPGIISIRNSLKEFYKLTAGTQDFIDTSVTEEEVVGPPKLPPAHYIQGQSARWQPEFESDIDHAVYFAGKSPLPKGAKQREVLDWLKSLGLTYEQIRDHREKVLEKIRETIDLPGVEEEYPYVYIDAVDQDFVLDVEEDDDEDFEDDLEGLDDLLDLVRTEDDISEEKVIENVEEAILDASEEESIPEGLDDLLSDVLEAKEEQEEQEEDEEDPLSDEDLERLLSDDEDVLEDIAEKLLPAINKPKRESSYTSNKKIFDSITANFGRIQSTLDVVNRNLEKQNELIKASIETQLAIGELISNQTNIMDQKFDLILKQFELQNAVAEKEAENEKKRSSERSLEAQRDSAGVSGYQDLTKKSTRKESNLSKYFKSKFAKNLYRRLPKSVRKTRQRIRNLQRIPQKVQAKALSKATSLMPSRGKKAVDSLSKIRGAGSISRFAGPAKYALAGLDYSERKASGQSEVQAMSGVASGLAGASLGGGLVAAGIALLPTAPTGVGAVAAGALILAGSILGGSLASGATDRLTGADKVQGKHETGTDTTKPGTAILHGTEAVIKKDAIPEVSPISTFGGIMLASATQYLNSAGPVASPIAPIFQGISAQLAQKYDVPSTVVQTNIGGSLPSLGPTIKKVKEKGKKGLEEELSIMEKDLLDTQDPQSFADKLLKLIDPQGKFQELLKNINNPTVTPGAGGQVGAEPFELLSGSQDPGQAGIDFTLKGTQNRAVLAGTVVEVGHQYNPNGTGGDGRKGSGYGNFVVIRSTNPIDGSQVDMLYAHFPKGEIKVKKGDQVSVGQDLGRMATAEEYANPTTRREVGSGTGPHTSLDFFEPGTNKAHSKARPLGDYILKELRKGSKGEIEKARQQAYQAQQSTRLSGALPTAQGLGRQGVTNNKNFGATSGVGSKGYLIVPGHAAGGGAPEEKRLVKQLAQNAYNNIKAKFPDANVQYQDTDGMFEETEAGFKKQLAWFKQKEKEGWEILEVHMDASIESGAGTGRGVIAPTGELNPVEAYFAQNYGAFSRGHRDLGAPKRGVGLFELGNMSPELQQASRQNRVSKQQLDALTAPLERSLQAGLNLVSAPASNQRTRFQSLQGSDNDSDTKFLIVNQQQRPNVSLPGGGAFIEMSPGRWKSNVELSTTMRNLYIQRLGQ